MTQEPKPNKVSLITYFSLLGTLTVGSVALTLCNDEIPGVVVTGRSILSNHQLQSVRENLSYAFESLPDWRPFCGDAKEILKNLNFGAGRHVVLEDEAWNTERLHLPRSERDAWSRCVGTTQNSHDLRTSYCFHVKGKSASESPWDSPFNLVELTLAWYNPAKKLPLTCEEMEGGMQPKELAVYYSIYWRTNAEGKNWLFERATGGMRLGARWQITQAKL